MKVLSEKYKFYFLIAMVIVAALVGYFRFLRPPTEAKKQISITESAGPQAASLAISRGAKKIKNSDAPAYRMPRRNISRNIFEPMGPLPLAPIPQPAAPARTADVDMTLNGTIIGNHASIAIVNNKFVRRGQQLGKYRITRITPDKVYLTSGDEQLCLNVISVTEAITP